MWWGDDGTLNDAVSKGNIAEDPLFREAEKMGIDIRKKRQDEMPSESQVCRSKNRDDGTDTTCSLTMMKTSIAVIS